MAAPTSDTLSAINRAFRALFPLLRDSIVNHRQYILGVAALSALAISFYSVYEIFRVKHVRLLTGPHGDVSDVDAPQIINAVRKKNNEGWFRFGRRYVVHVQNTDGFSENYDRVKTDAEGSAVGFALDGLGDDDQGRAATASDVRALLPLEWQYLHCIVTKEYLGEVGRVREIQRVLAVDNSDRHDKVDRLCFVLGKTGRERKRFSINTERSTHNHKKEGVRDARNKLLNEQGPTTELSEVLEASVFARKLLTRINTRIMEEQSELAEMNPWLALAPGERESIAGNDQGKESTKKKTAGSMTARDSGATGEADTPSKKNAPVLGDHTRSESKRVPSDLAHAYEELNNRHHELHRAMVRANRLRVLKEARDDISTVASPRLYLGPPGSGTWELARRALKHAGINDKDVSATGVNDFREMRYALKEGKLQGGFHVTSLDSRNIQGIAFDGKCRLVSMDYAEGMSHRYPYLRAVEIPRHSYYNGDANFCPSKIMMVGARRVLVASPSMSAADGFFIADAVKSALPIDINWGNELPNEKKDRNLFFVQHDGAIKDEGTKQPSNYFTVLGVWLSSIALTIFIGIVVDMLSKFTDWAEDKSSDENEGDQSAAATAEDSPKSPSEAPRPLTPHQRYEKTLEGAWDELHFSVPLQLGQAKRKTLAKKAYAEWKAKLSGYEQEIAELVEKEEIQRNDGHSLLEFLREKVEPTLERYAPTQQSSKREKVGVG